jgi:predicted flap endonuclease-1-like 5' DNA nuclease
MEWAAKYPDVAGMIKTIALKEVQGVREEITTTRQQIADEKLEAAKARAFGELMSEHPDFLDIRETEEFHTWAEGQAKWVRDALYENDTDAQAAIAAVDLFKFKTQKAAPKKATPKDDRKDAARGVGKSMTSAPDTEGRRNVFRESDLAKMDRKEYAKLSDEIDKAMREGRIDYDLSKPQSAAR